LRIRTLEETQQNEVGEGIVPEFQGIINYGVIAIMQLDAGPKDSSDANVLLELYDQVTAGTRDLMLKKNHDYGEAWRDMRISSLTDLILMKLLRIKQIEDNHGHSLASEGVDAGYRDIINYAAFALIRLGESDQ